MIALLLQTTLRRRAAAATRKLAERLRVEADWLQVFSGAIAGCGCTSRFASYCVQASGPGCSCDCHSDANARRPRTS